MLARKRTYWCLLLCAPLALACGGDDDTSAADGGPRDATADGSPGPSDGGDRDGGDDRDLGADPTCGLSPAPGLTLENLLETGGFDQPVQALTAPGGDPDVYYVVQKPGRISVVVDGLVRETNFLDFSLFGTGRGEGIATEGEQGLLGLAFHPDYASNGRFFVYFTPGGPNRNVLAEYRRSTDDPLVADTSVEIARLIELPDDETNHNGGRLLFGPDGYLYLGIGDGGGVADDHGEIGNGQDPTTLFGTILRLDVDNPEGDYASPGAPFVPGGAPQVWAYGLRNPWRFSFDAQTGDLWIGDVGERDVEEIDFLPAGFPGGANFGWRAYEGEAVFDADLLGIIDMSAYVAPVLTIPHGSDTTPLRSAISVTGGICYRGSAIPGLRGFYVYADYGSSDVAAFQYCDGSIEQHARLPGLRMAGGGAVSIDEDANGELLITNLNQGAVYRVVAP